jgi:hypothetical protein
VTVIDTLSSAFERLTRRLWLILIPALLDLAIWAGPRLSVQALSQQAFAALPNLSAAEPEYQQSLELAREWLNSVGTETDLLSMLSMRLMGLPSLTATLAIKTTWLSTVQRIIEVRTWPGLFLVIAGLTLVSLLAGSLCLSWLAQEARDEGLDLRYSLGVALRAWLRLCLLILFLVVAAAALLISLSFGYALVALWNLQFATLLFGLLAMAFVWVSAYAGIVLFFALRAMMLDNVGILKSVWSSLNIIHRSFWSTVFFIILINVIQTGLMYVWRLLAINVPGTLVSILGNAYISTGLVMASLIFYRDRFVAWQNAKPPATAGEGKA